MENVSKVSLSNEKREKVVGILPSGADSSVIYIKEGRMGIGKWSVVTRAAGLPSWKSDRSIGREEGSQEGLETVKYHSFAGSLPYNFRDHQRRNAYRWIPSYIQGAPFSVGIKGFLDQFSNRYFFQFYLSSQNLIISRHPTRLS